MPRLEPGMARIRVKDLRLRTYIGIKEEEINNKQDVLINLTILYPAVDAVRDNDIDHALNYRTITKAIIRHVEENRFDQLIEVEQDGNISDNDLRRSLQECQEAREAINRHEQALKQRHKRDNAGRSD